MPLKIRILKHDSPRSAIRSIAIFDAMKSISDDAKLRDAELMRYISNASAKKAGSPSERASYKKIASIYLAYISKIKKRIRAAKK